MRIVLHSTQAGSTGTHRSGATLTEVLMSLLIFSVGIVSVFTLFPVSLLSSIQATKLTNSKILADNVVEILRTNPELLRPPLTAASQNWRGERRSNTAYSLNDVVWPSIETGQLYPTPNLAYICINAGTAGAGEPVWLPSANVTDGSVTWAPMTANSNYVVDPLGAQRIPLTSPPEFFGFDGVNNYPSGGGDYPRRSDADLASIQAQILPFFAQPDTWTVVFEEVPVSVTDDGSRTSVEFSPNVDLAGVVTANHRLTIISADLKKSVTKPLGTPAVNGREINLKNVDANDLPNELDSISEISTVRLEVFNPRYSHFVTIRRTDPYAPPKVTAVLMFNRSFNTQDEEVYKANFGGSSYSDDSDVDGALNSDQARISWIGKQKPLLREGNYMFDARQVIWYRMTNISVNDSAQNAVITLDRSVEIQTVDTGTAADSVGRAIFLPGIVELIEL